MDTYPIENSVNFFMYTFKPILEGFGIFLNILVFILFCTTNSNKRLDNYLKLISMVTSLTLIVSIGSHDYDCKFFYCLNETCSYCNSFKATSLKNIVWGIYLQDIFLQTLIFLITLSEVLMTYDKLCLVQKKNCFLLKLNFKLIFGMLITSSVFIKIPDLFKYTITSSSNGTYEIKETIFGGSWYYKAYDIGYKTIVATSVLIIYITLVIKTIINLKEFLERKRRITNGNIKSGEKNMVKIVIWIGILRIFSLLVYFIRYFCIQIILNKYCEKIFLIHFLNLIIVIMEILVILTFIVNVFAIFRYHKTLRHLIFCCKTYK